MIARDSDASKKFYRTVIKKQIIREGTLALVAKTLHSRMIYSLFLSCPSIGHDATNHDGYEESEYDRRHIARIKAGQHGNECS